MPKKNKNKLKFGFSLGAFQEEMIQLFQDAGYEIKFSERHQKIEIDDPEIEFVLMRPYPMPSLIEKGILDVGITTDVAVLEAKAKVKEICKLEAENPLFGKTRVVIGVPKDSKIKSLKDLRGKKIVTRIPNVAKEFLEKNKISAEVIYLDTIINEATVGTIADAIIEFVQTGKYFRAYNLKILETVCERTIILITHQHSLRDAWKREKIENLAILLKGARLAQEYLGLMLHASNEMMEKVLRVLPALKKPTVTQLRGENWFDVLTVVNKEKLRTLIPTLKKIGCSDIVEFPLSKIVL